MAQDTKYLWLILVFLAAAIFLKPEEKAPQVPKTPENAADTLEYHNVHINQRPVYQ